MVCGVESETSTWAILVSRTGDDRPPLRRVSTQNVPVCTFKTSPCVPAPRAHVETVRHLQHLVHRAMCLGGDVERQRPEEDCQQLRR